MTGTRRPRLAALATIPGRPVASTLRSLRPQVDRLAVVCHRMREPPPAVRALADEWVVDVTDLDGSIAKLRWARQWDGLYLACDDDLVYPPDYAATMARWVEHWDRRALVTCHGRVLRARATTFRDATMWAHALRHVPLGIWLNYPGGCALAFDTALGVPDHFPGRNTEEAHLAVWAQARGVPIWLVPHRASWLRYLLPTAAMEPDPTRPHYTIWAEESAGGFANRNAVLAPQGQGPGWTVHELVREGAACTSR